MKLDQKIRNLEAMVSQLESEEIDLDQAVEVYTKAYHTAKEILVQLNQAKETVMVLEKDSDALVSADEA